MLEGSSLDLKHVTTINSALGTLLPTWISLVIVEQVCLWVQVHEIGAVSLKPHDLLMSILSVLCPYLPPIEGATLDLPLWLKREECMLDTLLPCLGSASFVKHLSTWVVLSCLELSWVEWMLSGRFATAALSLLSGEDHPIWIMFCGESTWPSKVYRQHSWFVFSDLKTKHICANHYGETWLDIAYTTMLGSSTHSHVPAMYFCLVCCVSTLGMELDILNLWLCT